MQTRPDIRVCSACKYQGVHSKCDICNIGNLFEEPSKTDFNYDMSHLEIVFDLGAESEALIAYRGGVFEVYESPSYGGEFNYFKTFNTFKAALYCVEHKLT